MSIDLTFTEKLDQSKTMLHFRNKETIAISVTTTYTTLLQIAYYSAILIFDHLECDYDNIPHNESFTFTLMTSAHERAWLTKHIVKLNT